MGAINFNETPINVKTRELTRWIVKVKVKRQRIKLQKRRNLLAEAVLSNAIIKAENLLRSKQEERRRRWKHIRPELADFTICEELENSINSLNDFMSQLNAVKASVQR